MIRSLPSQRTPTRPAVDRLIPGLVLFLLGSLLPGMSRSDPLTAAMLHAWPEDSTLHALVLMEERPDIDHLRAEVRHLPRDERSTVVWRELDDLARRSQRSVMRLLEQERSLGRVARLNRLRLTNGIVVVATPQAFRDVLDHPDVGQVVHIIPRRVETDSDPDDATLQEPPYVTVVDEDSVMWHIDRIQAPQAWQDGYSGEGVLMAVIDTGVNYLHADLADHMWDGGPQFPNHGWDFTDDDNDPMDESGHGSGVAGIAAGDGTSGIHTGVAPEVTVMALRVRQNLYTGVVTDTWLAQDFALEHGADIISMSLGWGSPGPEDRPIWRMNYELLEAAGIVCTKSAGNRRQDREPPNAISVPGDVPSPWRNPDEIEDGTRGGLITVGATNMDDWFSEFSSPGPVTWQSVPPWFDYPYGQGHQGMRKPDIAAPGTNGLSLTHEDDSTYTSFSNTSMAQPHVAGVVALLLSKNFNLTPVQVDSLLQTTAIDLGSGGKDNDFGAGLVQAFDALEAVPPVAVEPGLIRREVGLPDQLALDVIYPNPFNPWTTVRVITSEPGRLQVTVFNSLGREVDTLANRSFAAGRHELRFDASGLATGTYVIQARLNGHASPVTRKVTYTK